MRAGTSKKGDNGMKVKVKLFGQFRDITNSKEVELEINDNTSVMEAIDRLIATYPDLDLVILDGRDIKPYVSLTLNGRGVGGPEGLRSTIKEGDNIALFPPIADD